MRQVRGRVIGGGRGGPYLIAVDATFGRAFRPDRGWLGMLLPIQSIVARNPGSFGAPFDGTPEDAAAILDAARAAAAVEPQPREMGYPLPDVDIVAERTWRDW